MHIHTRTPSAAVRRRRWKHAAGAVAIASTLGAVLGTSVVRAGHVAPVDLFVETVSPISRPTSPVTLPARPFDPIVQPVEPVEVPVDPIPDGNPPVRVGGDFIVVPFPGDGEPGDEPPPLTDEPPILRVHDCIVLAAQAAQGTAPSKLNPIVADPDQKVILGTASDDLIIGNHLDNLIYGNGGNDTICAMNGNDNVNGGLGDDTIFGMVGDDRLLGDGYHAAVASYVTVPTSIHDLDESVAVGLPGNDTISGGYGSDFIDTGSGNDTVYAQEKHIRNETDTTDRIRGDGGPNTIHGHAGRDVVFGSGTHDTIFGYEGADSLDGRGGDDIIVGGEGPDILCGGLGGDEIHTGNRSVNAKPVSDNARDYYDGGGAAVKVDVYRATAEDRMIPLRGC